ncbi:MAG: hypothetical protein DMG27_13315 [Acidobacteria bacterium]|nr:MAG: hypothetical protein DMG27_13315 [Acidobacteriota bacterium]
MWYPNQSQWRAIWITAGIASVAVLAGVADAGSEGSGSPAAFFLALWILVIGSLFVWKFSEAPRYAHDMQKVHNFLPKQAAGKWLRFRIEGGKGPDSQNGTGRKAWWYVLQCLEEPWVGYTLAVPCSLEPNDVALLKALYEACHYNPGAEGHDPEQILGCEIYAKPTCETYQGDERVTVRWFNIREVTEPLPLR